MASTATQNSLTLTTRPLAISAPIVRQIQAGRDIAAIVSEAMRGRVSDAVCVDLNGYPVPASSWALVAPKADDHLLIYTKLHGGEGKNPLHVLMTIVVIAAAAYTGGLAATAYGPMAGAFAAAAVSTAGMFLVNAIAPVRPADARNTSYSDSPTYSISGARNVADPWGPIPQLLGRHKVYPRLGAKTFTEIEGGDEYLRLLLVWGYSPIRVGTIKIGDTPLSSFEGVEVRTYLGYDGEDTIDLFPSQVEQTPVGALVEYSSGWITRTAPENVDELSVDIYFNRGLVRIGNSSRSGAFRAETTVTAQIRYREVGTSAWTYTDGTVAFAEQSSATYALGPMVPGSYYDELGYLVPGETFSIYACHDGVIRAYGGRTERPLSVRIGEYTTRTLYVDTSTDIAWPVMGYDTVTNIIDTDRTGLVCSLVGDQVNITAGTITIEESAWTAKSPEVQRFSQRWKVDRTKAYEVAISRVTEDSVDDMIFDEMTWQYLRGTLNDNPINFEKHLTVTAFRIKATEQLSNVIDNVNAVCDSFVPVWDGSTWSTWGYSSNPAALFRHVLTGNANALKRTASQINDDQLADWFDECEDRGYSFNMYRDFRASIWDTLMDVAVAGRAAPSIIDGLWMAINDYDGRPISQHFTPRNSWGFSSEKMLFDMPHALRVKFVNADADYEWDERIVYSDGYTEANATLFESIEFPGVTDPDLIYRFARYHLAQMILRPETYSFYCDFEHLACRRGSMIHCGHDVPKWGTAWGRVKSISVTEETTEDGFFDDSGGVAFDDSGGVEFDGGTVGGTIISVTLDEEFAMLAGTSYACRFRKANGDSVVLSATSVTEDTVTSTFYVDGSVPASYGPAVGDLAMFGEATLMTARLLVKSITRTKDFCALLTCVDLAPSIYNADTESIPAFNTRITGPVDITRLAPPAPSISNVESGTRALEVTGALIRARILATVAPATSSTIRIGKYRLRYRATGTTRWSQVEWPADVGVTGIINGVIEGESYEIAAQVVSVYGVASDWSSSVFDAVEGQSEDPADVEDFGCNIVGSEARLTWTANTDLDLSHYRIRWSPLTVGATWANSVDVVANAGPTTSIAVAAMVGTYMIKAVDRSGRESATASTASTNIAGIAGLNFVEEFSQIDPSWSGTGTNVSASVAMGGLVLTDPETETGTFEFTGYVDLEAVFTSRLTASLSISGQDTASDLYDLTDLYEAENLYGAQESQYNVELYVATTEDDPAGTPTWSAWKPFLVGDYTARAYKFMARLSGTAPSITPILEAVTVTIDMPDRVLPFGADVLSSGSRVAFSPAFFAVPEIGISVFNGEEADYYAITNLDETGFDIAFTNGGAGVARTISGVAKGYGVLET